MTTSGLEYFILLGTRPLYNSTPHSFIALGTRNEAGKIEISAELGKSLDRDRFNPPCSTLFKQTFYHVDAAVYDEDCLQRKLFKEAQDHTDSVAEGKAENDKVQDDKAYALSYMAYQLSHEQFLRFRLNVERVKSLNDTPPEFKRPESIQRYDIIKQKTTSLSFFNNCRHTAIDFVELAQERALSHDIVPRFFMNALPFKTAIQKHEWTRPLVILPLPPTALDVDEMMFNALSKLYCRLEKLSVQSDSNLMAKEKYKALVGLYKAQVHDSALSLNSLFGGIVMWQNHHSKLIDTHRGWHFFWQSTATRRCINEVQSLCSTPPF